MEPDQPVHRWKDVDLTRTASRKRATPRKLKAQGIRFDVGYTSALKRAQRTLDLVLEEMGRAAFR